MKPIPIWTDSIQDKAQRCIYDLVFKPDGTQLLIAAGNRILVYNTEDGSLIQALKGHKDAVFCLSFAKDGQRFASGSADKTVIIWDETLSASLKYTHNDSIQCLEYNPMTLILVSCACTDFGLWSPEQKSVSKFRVNSRITSCSWTADGQYVALGLFSGTISIRNKIGDEKMKIERPNGSHSPIWSLKWTPPRENQQDVLAVADWGQRLSFYQLNGKQLGKDRMLDFDPCFVSWFANTDYVLVGGSDGKCSLFTRDGIKLGVIGEFESWVWCARTRPESQHVAVGCYDGTIMYYQVNFNIVHGLYRERYAYRDSMTDVIIHHLLTNKKVSLKCRDVVKKIAIYRNRLAVQLPEKVLIYELSGDKENDDMNYKIKEKINKKIDCNLLVVCSYHVIICLEKRLTCMNFQGVREREWITESLIRYIKVTGGPQGREGLLVGLKNGQVLHIFIDNPFPVVLVKQSSVIRCLDLNSSREKLAIVDDHFKLLVYDVRSKELLYQEPNANSVAWNTSHQDMLCFSGNNGVLSIKANNFPVHQQKQQGYVVGFMGSKIFSLYNQAIRTVDVLQSAPMYQYLEKKMFRDSYTVACLGVSEQDWRTLGTEALEGLELAIAKQSFIRVRDLKMVELVESIEERRKRGGSDPQQLLADIYAYQGRFSEAARLYKKTNYEHKALEMYTDLRMFDHAKEYIGATDSEDSKRLVTKQAEWAESSNDPRLAAEMFIAAGEFTKAIEIIGQNNWPDIMMNVARQLDKADRERLSRCAHYLKKMKHFLYAAEVYNKMGDIRSLVGLYAESGNWDEAFAALQRYPELKEHVYYTYAQWLAERDRFVEAQQAFHKAGRRDDAVRVLEKLTYNAVAEARFTDASYYYWLLSMQYLEIARDSKENSKEFISKFAKYQSLADIYYAYHSVQRYTDEPFTSRLIEELFNISRFLFHSLLDEVPHGVSKVGTLFTLAKVSGPLGAYKLARNVYEKLQALRIPHRFQETIDLNSISVRAKPLHDADELVPMCYRCSTSNPLFNEKGSCCIKCFQPFIHSFVSFDILPLVEFFVEDDVQQEEAQQLVDSVPVQKGIKAKKSRGYQDSKTAASQSMRMDDNAAQDEDDIDVMTEAYSNPSYQTQKDSFKPMILTRDQLKALDPTHVYVCKWPKPLKWRFYRTFLSDIPITICSSCFRFFQSDEYELSTLKNGYCPFCRKPRKEREETEEADE